MRESVRVLLPTLRTCVRVCVFRVGGRLLDLFCCLCITCWSTRYPLDRDRVKFSTWSSRTIREYDNPSSPRVLHKTMNVDGCLVVCKSAVVVTMFKKEILTRFIGTDEDEVTQYLRCDLMSDRKAMTVKLVQSGYAKKMFCPLSLPQVQTRHHIHTTFLLFALGRHIHTTFLLFAKIYVPSVFHHSCE